MQACLIFLYNCTQAFLKHVDFNIVRCAVLASSGFTKVGFVKHFDNRILIISFNLNRHFSHRQMPVQNHYCFFIDYLHVDFYLVWACGTLESINNRVW